ncbi:MAG: UDP-glucose/GDP-mannose dehydrogenase family protein [Candidatus Lokiarchaeota archaeon]|nr:UDP-glucose/GDP-mannose dehydrogenase family protein [Candidatus Lokiarchaeota archaeon]
MLFLFVFIIEGLRMSEKYKVTFIGTGYVGLVTAACFAKIGMDKKAELDLTVFNNDIIEDKINIIKKGHSPFFEEGFNPILKEVIDNKVLIPELNLEMCVKNSDILYICVGTPSKPTGEVDLSYIKNVAKDLGKILKSIDSYKRVCVKSTVVPETTRDIVGKTIEEISGKKIGKDFGLLFIPEFLREGNAVEDTLNPDRIIIGEQNENDGIYMEKFYKNLFYNVPILRMSLESAEMVKYAANCFLATKISFANEIASIAEKTHNVDVGEVMKGVGSDSRISPNFFNAGAGFGGSCFPKDVSAFISFSKERDYEPRILKSVLNKNYEQAIHVVDLARSLVLTFKDKIIAILGLSFKPGTSDMREAPAIKIINKILEENPKLIKAYDPVAVEEAKQEFGNAITYAESIEECLKDSDICIIVTEWPQFANIKPELIKNLMKNKNIVDGRRIIDSKLFEKEFQVKIIGRGILSK